MELAAGRDVLPCTGQPVQKEGEEKEKEKRKEKKVSRERLRTTSTHPSEEIGDLVHRAHVPRPLHGSP